MRKLANSGRMRAGVEPRHVEQRAEDFLNRLERGVDIVDQAAVVAAALALDQAGDVEPRRVERLQDVVARRRQELGLGNIGGVGLALGARKRGIEPREFLGALAHAPLQRFVGALERFRRLHAGVMSVKVVTMPPSGMRLARTSITMPSAKRSRNGSLPET